MAGNSQSRVSGFPSIKPTLKTPRFQEPKASKPTAVKGVNIQGQLAATAGPVLRKLFLSQRKMDRIMNPLANQSSGPQNPKSVL